MARNLRIPEHRRTALRALTELTDACVKELFGALASVSPALYGPQLPQVVAKKVSSSDSATIEAVVDMLLSLYPAIINSDKSVDEFIDDIVNSITAPGEDQIPEDKATSLRVNLQKLLKVPSLTLGAKATSVMFEYERSLASSRILTDIRPVFELESTEVGGALIVHTLKIEYFSADDGQKEFFVSLDSHDLDVLIFNLERAKQKAEKLKAVLAAASVRLIEQESDE